MELRCTVDWAWVGTQVAGQVEGISGAVGTELIRGARGVAVGRQ